MAIHSSEEQKITHFAKIYSYPCGVTDILASTRPVFREPGWETAEDWRGLAGKGEALTADPKPTPKQPKQEADPEALARSMRRARAKVRRLALSNDFEWFVTLTLNQKMVDRYDPEAVVKKLNQWLSNQVKRKGLSYVLVPERHKDGAIHFHGFFNGALEAVPSGHRDKAGHEIFNFPGWTLGFTAGIRVYGDYPAAVAYVCKYIGKQGDKPAGRWYYSGGALREPEIIYADISARDLEEEYGKKAFMCSLPGQQLCIVNGIRENDTTEWEEIEQVMSNLLDGKED